MSLAVPGVLCVAAIDARTPSGRQQVHLGPAAGWMVPRGIAHWERELSLVVRSDMTAGLARSLRATMPHEQIAARRFPAASQAVELSPLLGLANDLVDDARAQGVRVHTVGVDRVSSGFYYFAEGDGRPPVNVQGNLVEMLAPSLDAASTNADIVTLMEGLIGRLLLALSDGVFSELEIELADALPRLSRSGTGLVGTDLETFDTRARILAEHSARHAAAARRMADALGEAGRLGHVSVDVPLYGVARREARAPLDVTLGSEPLRLPEWPQWIVTGPAREQIEPAPTARAAAARTTAAAKTTPANPPPDGARQRPRVAVMSAEATASTTEAASATATAGTSAPAPAARPLAAAPAAELAEGASQALASEADPAIPAPTPAIAPQPVVVVDRDPAPEDVEPAAPSPGPVDLAAAPPSRPRPRAPAPTADPDARRSLAIFVAGLVAFAGAIAYSAWRLWHGHLLH